MISEFEKVVNKVDARLVQECFKESVQLFQPEHIRFRQDEETDEERPSRRKSYGD